MGETDSQPAVKIQWSNELKAMYSTTSSDGVVRVYSCHDAIIQSLFKSKKAAEITAPHMATAACWWYLRLRWKNSDLWAS
jgi:hypothetical protein